MTYVLQSTADGVWPPGLGWTSGEIREIAACWEPDAHLPIPPWLTPVDPPSPTPAPEPEE